MTLPGVYRYEVRTTNSDYHTFSAQHIRKWFMDCYQRKTVFYPRPVPTQAQPQPTVAGGSTNASIVQIPIF